MPSLKRLGRAPAVRIHDTATGRLVTSAPSQGEAVRLYVCGITPYDATHIGHAATYLAFDLLNRAWRDAGHPVRYVQNVTDVDDPLLERAARDGEDWRELADREIERFRGDCEALRILPPDDYVGVVEALDTVIAMVQTLDDLGHTYDVEGDRYFSARADPAFGSVAHLSHDDMVRLSASRGGDPDRPGKKDPVDSMLWRAERPGEPAWESPFGRGRPGWHVECSAIAVRALGPGIDVQGGGNDLVFPHHEMSASQAQAATPGTTFARAYMHAGMVAYHGEKMSKSLGNLVFVSRLRSAGVDPAAIRLAIISHHYRANWEWTDDSVAAAQSRLEAWRRAAAGASTAAAESLVGEVRAALADDLDTPRALAALDGMAATAHPDGPADGRRDGHADGEGSGARVVRDLVDARLGILL